MAQRSTPDGWVSPSDAPTNVRVTVVPGPRAHPVRDRGAATRAKVEVPLVVVSIVMALAAGAIVAVALRGGRPMGAAAVRPRETSNARIGFAEARRRAGPAAVPMTETGTARLARVAAVYRYPLGCLGIALSADRSVMLGRHSPCWHYGVYVTAVLHQVNGVWRLMLAATSPKCPAVALPDTVRSALVECERSATPAPSG